MDERSPSSEVRRLMATGEGYDDVVWKQMGQELGLQGISIGEPHGGQGFGPVELGIVLEEMGRALFGGPFFGSVCVAAPAIAFASTEEEKTELLAGIASGDTIAALAFTEPDGRWDATGIAMEATPEAGAYVLNGTKTYVLDGHNASLIAVAARLPGTTGTDGIGLFAVEGDAEGLTRTLLDTIDQTRKQARLVFDGVRARPLGTPGEAWPALSKALDVAAVFLSAEMTGGAQRCLDMAVEYAKNRVQFGRPIGSFQAIKHKCADMLLRVESAKAASYYAAWIAAEDSDELPVAASLAKAYCSDAYFFCATENIQVHGGMGFTWEHDAHLYFRRAKSSELLFGDATYHRELLAQRLGI
jgi:alkylation response protein AidB-like acyl-CoA dehydrogenase